MKGFISYRFTGAKVEDINALLAPVRTTLEENGHSVYVNFYDDDLKVGSENHKKFGPQDYIFHAFSKLNDRDFVIVLLNSDEKSEGMLLEVGYAMARGISVVVALKDGISKTYLPKIGTTTFVWSDLNDLLLKLKNLDLNSLKSRVF